MVEKLPALGRRLTDILQSEFWKHPIVSTVAAAGIIGLCALG